MPKPPAPPATSSSDAMAIDTTSYDTWVAGHTLGFDEAVPIPPTPAAITSEMWGTFMDGDDIFNRDMTTAYDSLTSTGKEWWGGWMMELTTWLASVREYCTAIKCGAYSASETESTPTARGNAWSKCVRAQRERGGLSIGPGVVMAATHFAIATVASWQRRA
jgi:hypothetical protein